MGQHRDLRRQPLDQDRPEGPGNSRAQHERGAERAGRGGRDAGREQQGDSGHAAAERHQHRRRYAFAKQQGGEQRRPRRHGVADDDAVGRVHELQPEDGEAEPSGDVEQGPGGQRRPPSSGDGQPHAPPEHIREQAKPADERRGAPERQRRELHEQQLHHRPGATPAECEAEENGSQRHRWRGVLQAGASSGRTRTQPLMRQAPLASRSRP